MKDKKGIFTAQKRDVSQHISSSVALDDEQRIKILSPSMLVFKRFIRNQLAIAGVVCIVAMFMFAFVGGWVMPYGESQIFTEYVDMSKDYAGVTANEEFRYTEAQGKELPMAARAKFIFAVNKGEKTFESQNKTYSLENIGTDFYLITDLQEVANAGGPKNNMIVKFAEGNAADAGFEDAFRQAIADKAKDFTFNGTTYTVVNQKKFYYAYRSENLAIASINVFDYANAEILPGFDFQYQAELAMNKGTDSSFSVNGMDFAIKTADGIGEISLVSGTDRSAYAVISRYIVQSVFPDVFLTTDFKDAVKLAISENQSSFSFTDETGDVAYTILRENKQWMVRKITDALVVRDYESPSTAHWLGTDPYGMDIITRLMYGGRISLMIGFIVVLIETFIGVILGGIAGYFGKWVDNLLMRIVDIFNCIPSLPLIIILGAVMDALKVDPQVRMIYLMLILGFLGWPSIARLVRGQILSLREQEFMVAAEATGLSVYRKIFKHLVPNVIPQLIVISTMSLGGVILTESVLSFLGLGVKFPFASWGNIINAVSNVHVMTNYWFVWIPAGFCILITVLGFNFIGDGLRDAFDPKMKR